MSVFATYTKLSYAEKELVVFDEAFREIHTQLRHLESSSERLEGVKDLLKDKTFKNTSSQTTEFDLAQALLLVVNRIEANED